MLQETDFSVIITPSGKKSRLLRLTESSLQTQQRLQYQNGKETYWHQKTLYKFSSVWSKNLLGKNIHERLKNLYKLNNVCRNNAHITEKDLRHLKNHYNSRASTATMHRQENFRASEEPMHTKQRLRQQRIRHLKNLYKLNNVCRNNALHNKIYGHLKYQYKLNSV
ncbi:hypothetical protein AVEN_243990-1 [Araneus ventricosus]|uniref:Uncharacterized protein n=1 Tax=Araneus ventricosus TaxID=182803 RepID=A0A4Y2IM72_ARAVE|nr:hypothetical protein AVEN_243990-1 [Araneus ventricosus]